MSQSKPERLRAASGDADMVGGGGMTETMARSIQGREVGIVAPSELDPHFSDLYDHALRAAEWTESVRDMITTVFETNLSLADARLNSVMKKLTGWAAIISSFRSTPNPGAVGKS